jgi:UDP-N-acetyl-2-amino-2-deoxyglucuronate dehydrogenase
MSYGIGIVGTGLIAEFHARAIAEVENANLAGVMSRSAERAAAFGQRFGCPGYDSLKALLADPKVEIVSICTPSGAHLEPALKAIEAGRHLVIEKPLEISLERCDRILEAAERRGVLVSGIFQSRFYDSSRVLKQAVDAGRFGRLVLGDAYVKWYRSQDYYGGWKGTRRFDGGGALMNQSIHAIDLLQWMMGPVRSVQAVKACLGHRGIEVEDTAAAVLEFASGACGVIEGSTAVFPGFLKRIEISGTRGSAILEEEDLIYWRFEEESGEDEEIRRLYAGRTASGGGAADPAAISFVGHQRQFQDFVDALKEKRSPLIDATEARKSVAIILAIYASAESGKKISL